MLILDEPTSGLDSGSALNVMMTLKAIAGERRTTVVLSIHQPSFKILSTIDGILLLSKGSVVHHGTMATLEGFLNSGGFQVPPQLNALEFAMEILDQLEEKKNMTTATTTLDSDPRVCVTPVDCRVGDPCSDGAHLRKDITVR